MKTIINYEGKTYIGAEDKENTAEKMVASLSKRINEMDMLSMPLEDGSFLLLGADAIKRCAFLFTDK